MCNVLTADNFQKNNFPQIFVEIHVQRTSDVETEWLLEAVCGHDDDDDDDREEEE